MTKKRIIKKIHELDAFLNRLLKETYPNGYRDHLVKIETPNNKRFYAITLEAEDAIYLVKLDTPVKGRVPTADELLSD